MMSPICPACGSLAKASNTRYGIRHTCCGLHSWDGKPIVSQQVHDARQRCHAAFDPIWQKADIAYEITEPVGSDAHAKAVKRIRKSMRNRAYHFLSFVTGLPEPECHMSDQADLSKLAAIEAAAKVATPHAVRDWWHSNEARAA